MSPEIIWCRWVRRLPSKEGIKEGYPHLEIVILPLFQLLFRNIKLTVVCVT